MITHIKADIRSDFILAPHYNLVFNRAGDELWDQLKQLLQSGAYEPELPITMSIPKERWFSRPGSILKPYDRFLYQALIDHALTSLEETLDRNRTFSHVPSEEDDEVFVPNHECWDRFQEKITEICGSSRFIIKSDISNYFERLPQHHLVNLMTAGNCAPEIVKLLEEMMLAFRERNSFGIIQGVFPSDVLGNFFLSDLDGYCEIGNIPSARYVDDIYMGFDTEAEARQGLGKLIEKLRKDGLHLNEYKTGIRRSRDVLREETTIDRLFDEIREEVKDDQTYERASPYAFEAEWDEDDEVDDDENEDELENAAVERLMENIDEYEGQADKIERFCLPILRTANSDSAVDYVLEKLEEKPHQTRLYFSYLTTFVRDSAVAAAMERLVDVNGSMSDYQKIFLLAALMRARGIGRPAVVAAVQWLQNPHVSREARAMAAIFVARHGGPTQKRAVRTWYESEQSDYVRSAILYSSRYLSAVERKTCKRAWGGHGPVNALISSAL